jgi:hypothetical protein
VGFLLATLPAARRSSPPPGLSGRSPPAGRSATSPRKKIEKKVKETMKEEMFRVELITILHPSRFIDSGAESSILG